MDPSTNCRRLNAYKETAVFSEDDLIPISALQHMLYCERQFALIHVEQQWADNRHTAEGNLIHEKVDGGGHESRKLFRQEYGMAIRSLKFGIIGKCDLVELSLRPDGVVAEALPVEYKRGREKEGDYDRAQLCAQAFCLEEMFGIQIDRGGFYYFGAHRRSYLEITNPLRKTTADAIVQARAIISSGATPGARYEHGRCNGCSLAELCMPKAVADGGKRVSRYITSSLTTIRKDCS